MFKSKSAVLTKKKIIALTPTFAIMLCVVLYILFFKPIMERYTWELSTAQQAEPYFVVAHNPTYDFSDENSPLYTFSKPIEPTCVAENGNLL